MVRRAKVDIRPVKKAIDALNKQVGDVSDDALEEIAERAKEYATELFEAAEYDGVNDVVVDLREYSNGVYVVAHGRALPFIEYGTGLNKEFWYFSGEGGDVQLTATGRTFKHRYTENYEKTPSGTEYRVIDQRFTSNGDVFLQQSQHKNVKRDEKGVYIMHPRFGRVALSRFEVEGDYTGKRVKELVERTPVYNSEGNPPNDVMAQTREYIREIAPDIVNKYIKRFAR